MEGERGQRFSELLIQRIQEHFRLRRLAGCFIAGLLLKHKHPVAPPPGFVASGMETSTFDAQLRHSGDATILRD